MLVTKQNRPPPPQEENLDAAQSWNASADGRRDTSDSRFSVGASGGRYAFSPSPEEEGDEETYVLDPDTGAIYTAEEISDATTHDEWEE